MKIKPGLAAILWCASTVPLLNRAAFSQTVTIATVPVGNVNNPSDPDNGLGTVSYEYNIGAYDVTSAQYCAFLNAVAASDPYGIYHPNMASTTVGNPGIIQSGQPGNYTYSVIDGRGNYPVADVSFWNATRFANWLDNGQPVAPEGLNTTEKGTYDLYDNPMDAALVAQPTGKQNLTTNGPENLSVTRAANSNWAVTSENEWYKAAYYSPLKNPAGPGGAYFQYPPQNSDDSIYSYELNCTGTDTTPVGSYSYPTYFGTYDQGGNVYQWNESIFNSGGTRGLRGGAWDSADLGRASSSESLPTQPWQSGGVGSNGDIGFRVVQLNTMSPGGLLDVSNKSVVISSPAAGALATIVSQLRSGYNKGSWNGSSGIVSSTAAADSSHLTAVGVMINDTGANSGNSTGTAFDYSFGGSSTSDGDILIKYTYYGDANLSGSVDGSDYSLIDNGYLKRLTGWYNGDFNYDGVIDGSDYAMIDNSFNSQGASLESELAASTAQIANASTVPEPADALVLGLGTLLLFKSSRRALSGLNGSPTLQPASVPERPCQETRGRC